MSKAGLAVCSLSQQHFSKALKDSKEKIDLLNGELTSLADGKISNTGVVGRLW